MCTYIPQHYTRLCTQPDVKRCNISLQFQCNSRKSVGLTASLMREIVHSLNQIPASLLHNSKQLSVQETNHSNTSCRLCRRSGMVILGSLSNFIRRQSPRQLGFYGSVYVDRMTGVRERRRKRSLQKCSEVKKKKNFAGLFPRLFPRIDIQPSRSP